MEESTTITEEGAGPADQGASESTGSTPGPANDAGKREAELRRELREERAKRLGLQYGFPDDTVNYLMSVERDKQDAAAAAIAAARGTTTPEGAAPPKVEETNPPQGAEHLTAVPTNDEPGTIRPKITTAEVVAFQRDHPDEWLKFRRKHPVEAEALMRGEVVEGLSLTG